MSIQATMKGLSIKTLLLVALLFTLTWFINLPWFDEPLHPDLVSLATPSVVSMNDNSFPLVHAFAAGIGKDPLVAGKQIVQTIRDRYHAGEKPTLSDEEMGRLLDWGDDDDEWRSDLQSLSCNSRLSLDCAGQLIDEIQELDPEDPRLRVLLERYDEVLQTPNFLENEEADASTPLPSYGLLMQVARVRLAISYRQDTVEQFLVKVDQDMRFWRTVLRDGQTLIAKMVALAGLRNDLEFLSLLIRLRDLSEGELQSIRDTLSPLTDDELDIGESFLTEVRIALLSENLLFVLVGNSSWTSRLFLQEKATLNDYYLRIVVPLRLRATLSAREFYEERGYDRIAHVLRVFPPPLYNLGGQLALKHMSTKSSAQDYISRVHDVNGRIALVLLQAEIAENPELGVESILRSSTQKNPYTGESMDYDDSTRTIGFECLTENPGDICRVRIQGVGS